MKNAREVAADILTKIDGGSLSHAAFNEALRLNTLEKNDRDFVKVLVSGCLEHINEIDHVIDSYSKKKSSGLKPIVRNVLRISIYQLTYLSDIPASAVCNEAVKIIDRRKIYGLKGFVNAVLRNYSENVQKTENIKSSEIPKYVYDILEKRVGTEMIETVLSGFDKPAKVVCRFNNFCLSNESISNSLKEQNIIANRAPYASGAYVLSGFDSVGNINAFKDGLIQIQGLASQLACEILNPVPGSILLDICASPDGKTVALANIMGNKGKIIARDITSKKVKMIFSNAERTKMSIIEPEEKDACIYYPDDENKYDYIMADLPCSGLGTMGHKIEVRYKSNAEKTYELAALQRKILDNAVKYLKPGGFMVYSTCTFTYEENEDNYKYIKDVLGLIPVAINVPGLSDSHESSKFGYLQLLPGIDEVSDGFFISLFKKANNA